MKESFRLNVLVIVLALGCPAWCAEQGLVAHYNFDEGSSSVLRDVSGNGNDGQIHGASYVRRGNGYCLDFDGVDDFVDCGNKPSLDIRDAITLEAWVFPAHRVKGEVGIVGKHFESYLLSYYADGQCWWYISSGGNNAKGFLTPGSWQHFVGTFDGHTLRLFIDGKLVNANPSKFDKIKQGRNFFIGCVIGDPNATDPNYTRTAFFPGQIDEVKVYNRALSEQEVKSHFQAVVKDMALAAHYQPVKDGQMIRQGNVSVRVGKQGQMQVDIGKESYIVESSFSYPGEQIGWNRLSGTERGGEAGWSPRVRKVSTDAVAIEASGKFYSLRRVVKLVAPTSWRQAGWKPALRQVYRLKVVFEDTLTNLRTEPTGFIVRTSLTAPKPFKNSLTPGGAENPTIYLAGGNGGLGVLVEDNISRLRFEPSLGLPANQARFQVGNFALDVGKSYTMRWSLYPLKKGAGYFDFINQVRRDWNTNFTIEGPFAFFELVAMRELLDYPDSPGKLKAYLKRKRLKVVGLAPWLDYDPGSFDRASRGGNTRSGCSGRFAR